MGLWAKMHIQIIATTLKKKRQYNSTYHMEFKSRIQGWLNTRKTFNSMYHTYKQKRRKYGELKRYRNIK
jgi:hypothetical protein